MKATRKFISDRQPHCKYLVETKQVKLIGGGKENRCYDNAYKMIDRKRKIRMVSGWIVCKNDYIRSATEIVQHFWNAYEDGEHFDTSFGPNSLQGDYVIDADLIDYCIANDQILRSHIASSLLLDHGNYQAVDENEHKMIVFRPIRNLCTAELYRTKLSCSYRYLLSA